MNGLSLFAGAGIAEMGFNNTKINIKIANEIIDKRVEVHRFWHPNVKVINGDITNNYVKQEIIDTSIVNNVEFILATPPCQGMSLIGKNKNNNEMLNDNRNYLIFDAFDIIDVVNPKYVLIENVPRFLKIKYRVGSEYLSISEIVRIKYSKSYNIEISIYNCQDYGVPQSRERAIIRIWKKGLIWNEPQKSEKITVREAIGSLPSLESGEMSKLKNHFARKHTDNHILWMSHTETGKSAFENTIHYPKNQKTGDRLKGFSATYKRIEWDNPAPTITMRNDAISSQSNVHPGRKRADGTFSDARVLTLREIFILMSMDPDLDVPPHISEIQIRHMVGEAVPPRLINAIVKGIKTNE